MLNHRLVWLYQLKQYVVAKDIYQRLLLMLENASLDERTRRLWQARIYHQLGSCGRLPDPDSR
jgi:hypothetical protein